MKYLLTALAAIAMHTLLAQAPAAISYQAVARNAIGEALANNELIVKIGILANGIDGTLMWEEEHAVLTDDFGLFDFNIGQGASTGNGNSTAFANINWGAATYFLRVEAEAGNGVFDLLGTSQLMSVPYAFYANRAGNIDEAQISAFTFSDQTLEITEGDETFSLDISDMFTEIIAGQSINLVQLVGTELNIVEGSEAFVVDLSPLLQEIGWTMTDEGLIADQLPVGIGTANPQSTMHINGSVSYTVQLVEGPINVNIDQNNHVILANVSAGIVTLNLPVASSCLGRVYTIKRQGTLNNPVLLLPSGGAQIEGSPNLSMTGNVKQVVQIISDGINWWVISRSNID